jgi:hypothetical protein
MTDSHVLPYKRVWQFAVGSSRGSGTVFTIGIGIIAGGVLSTSETLDEQLTAKNRHTEKQTRGQ